MAQIDAYGQQLVQQLTERMGQERFRELLSQISRNLEAFAVARDEGLSSSEWADVVRLPAADVDAGTRELILRFLDHALRQAAYV